MNRLFVLLAAGLLGSGCIVSSDVCDASTVWISWPSFVRATSTGYTTTTACSGIDGVDVYVDGGSTPYSAACLDDAVGLWLDSGSHWATVEALDGNGFPILRDEISFTVSDSCGDQIVDTQPGEGVVTVNYDFDGAACTAGGSYMWFNVHDDVANVDIAGVDHLSDDPAKYACNVGGGGVGYLSPPFVLPAGAYTLDWMEEVYYSSGAYHVAANHCSPSTFSVDSGIDTSTTSIYLADSSASCE
jgi:hypothetical protein